MFTATSEQTAIIHEIINGATDLVVAAGPGSGKTTTALNAMKGLPSTAKIAFVCFNKKIADENKVKAPKHVEVYTLNGFGWGVCLKALNKKGYQKVDSYKTQNKLQAHLGGKWNNAERKFVFGSPENAETYYKTCGAICTLVGLCKSYAMFTPDVKRMQEIADLHNVEIKIDDADMFFSIAMAVFTACINDTNILDWDDQIYFPMKYGWNVPQFDYVFVDEAQDLNEVQLMLVMAMAGK